MKENNDKTLGVGEECECLGTDGDKKSAREANERKRKEKKTKKKTERRAEKAKQ